MASDDVDAIVGEGFGFRRLDEDLDALDVGGRDARLVNDNVFALLRVIAGLEGARRVVLEEPSSCRALVGYILVQTPHKLAKVR